MKKFVVIHSAALALIALAATALADTAPTATTARVGNAAPGFTLPDAHGKNHSLSDFEGKYVVLEWVNFGCPFVKKHYHSGNMQRLQSHFAEKEVVWLSICSSAPGKQGYFAGDDLTEVIESEKSRADAYLVDTDGTVGRLFEAKTTPNMYIIDPKGILIYAGAIDSTPSVDPKDIPASVNYVSAALEAVLSGKEVQVKATQPYGCSVKYNKN